MEPKVIQLKESQRPIFFWVLALLLLITLPANFPLNAPARGAHWMTGFLAFATVFFAYLEYIGLDRLVEVDIASQEVREHRRTLLLRRRTTHYAFHRFNSVMTYTVWGQSTPQTYLDLGQRGSSESVTLLRTSAPLKDSTFFSAMSEYQEAPTCKEMRERLAKELQLTDRGFLGNRWLGVQAKPDKVSIQ